MQRLSIKTSEDNGLSFTLHVDGRPLSEAIGCGSDNPAIPYDIIEDDLPYFPPHGDAAASSRNERIVGVCECGEYGCGHMQCIVEKCGDLVIFRDFGFEVSDPRRKVEFVFSRVNYDDIVAQIVALATAKKMQKEPND